tara:strand:+ start:271 stop:387 length:117 start_codon:yes stop_codon:yes gene_type:complete
LVIGAIAKEPINAAAILIGRGESKLMSLVFKMNEEGFL